MKSIQIQHVVWTVVFGSCFLASTNIASANTGAPESTNQSETPPCGPCSEGPATVPSHRAKARPSGSGPASPTPGARRSAAAGYLNPRRGSVVDFVTDVSISTPTFEWYHRRNYDSRHYKSNGSGNSFGYNGNRWISNAQGPFFRGSDDDLVLYVDASSKRTFTAAADNMFDPPSDYNATLVRNNTGTATEEYVLTEIDSGQIFEFHGLSSNVTSKNRGRLKTRSTIQLREAGGEEIDYTYNTKGYVSTVSLPGSYSVTYTYNTTGNNVDRLDEIEVEKSTTLYRRVNYTYYDSGGSHHADTGNTACLLAVEVAEKSSHSAAETVRSTMYRYYPSGNEIRQLRMVFEPDAVQRIIDADPNDSISDVDDILDKANDYEVVTGVEIQDYASVTFTYYTSDEATNNITTPFKANENLENEYGGSNASEYVNTGRVKTITFNGECGSCGGASGGVKKSYFYMFVNSGTSDPDDVNYVVVEDVEDSAGAEYYRKIYGVNVYNVLLREVTIQDPYPDAMMGETYKAWCQSYTLDSNLRTAEMRMPSAHDGSVTSNLTVKEFLDPTGDSGNNDGDTLDDDDGLIFVYDYDDGGNPVHDTLVKFGEDAVTQYYVSAADWGDADGDDEGVDNDERYVIAATYTYPDKTPTRSNGKKTSYDFTFWDDASGTDKQIKTVTTTLPTIGTGQNGSDTATTMEEYYDEEGRLRWTKDGEGYVNYMSYHPDLGGLALEIRDVETSGTLNSDITGTGSGNWVAWSGSAGLTRDANLPTAFELTTKTEYDEQGRVSKVEDPDGDEHYTVYETDRVIQFPHWSGTTSRLPIQVSDINDGGQLTKEYAVRLDFSSISITSSEPTGFSTDPGQGDYVSLTNYSYDDNGQMQFVDAYHDIPSSGDGTLSTNYHRTAYLYDTMGRRDMTVQVVDGTAVSSSTEQVTKQTFDIFDRVTAVERGVSDTDDNMSADYDDLPALTKVTETEYDDGGVGDGHVTKTKRFFGTDKYVGSNSYYTYRGHLRGVEPMYKDGGSETEIGPYTVIDVDWEGKVTARALYDTAPNWTGSVLSNDHYDAYAHSTGGTSTNRRTLTETKYDDLSRAYETLEYTVNSSTGSEGKYFRTQIWYDRNDRVVCNYTNNQMATVVAFDGVGRQYQSRDSRRPKGAEGGGYYSSAKFRYRDPEPDPEYDSGDTDKMTGGDDEVKTISHQVFDAGSNVIEEHFFDANHDDNNGIDLSNHDDYVRRSVYHWYDEADRLTETADYGSGNSSSGNDTWTYVAPQSRGASAPSTGDRVHVAQYGYHDSTSTKDDDGSGRLEMVTDAEGIETRTLYDKLGRATHVIENFTNFELDESDIGGGTNNEDDRVTKTDFNGLGSVTKLTAYNGSSTSKQETLYLYEDDVDASWVTNQIYPDSNDTTSAGSDQVKLQYNFDGTLSKRTDQRGTVIDYYYNDRRQPDSQVVSTPGGADTTVRSITREFDDLARVEKITSHSDQVTEPDDTGSPYSAANVVNQIVFTYNDLSKVTKSQQDHDGVVSGSTPDVQYTYDLGGSGSYGDNARLEKITYPDGRVIFYTYGGAGYIDDRIDRVRKVRLNPTGNIILADYLYTAAGRLAQTSYGVTTGQPDVRNSFHDNDNDDIYEAYDRFGRIKTHEWEDFSGGVTTIDQFDYTYDYVGNRLSRDIPSSLYSTDDKDQVYTYDELHRLKEFDQGTLVSGAISSPQSEEDWTLDQLGNWSDFIQKSVGTTTLDQDRTHNDANEIGTITASTGTNWADPVHDAAGNMTEIPKPSDLANNYDLKYDAWNRLVEVDDGASNVATYEYDGLNRRVQKVDQTGMPSVTYDYYYNTNWQVLEVHKAGEEDEPLEQYVWHPYYIDALAVRYYDSDTDGMNIAEHYYCHDANFNVTAVVDDSETVLERYEYTPYGDVTYMDLNFSTISSSTIANPCLFTGRRLDGETGLHNFRKRYFNAQMGRFVNRDPIGYAGSKWNLYEYVRGIPLSSVDPFGLNPCGLPETLNTYDDDELKDYILGLIEDDRVNKRNCLHKRDKDLFRRWVTQEKFAGLREKEKRKDKKSGHGSRTGRRKFGKIDITLLRGLAKVTLVATVIYEGDCARVEIEEMTEEFDRKAKRATNRCAVLAHEQALNAARGHFQWERKNGRCKNLDESALQGCYQEFYDLLQSQYLLDCAGVKAANINSAVMQFRKCLDRACEGRGN